MELHRALSAPELRLVLEPELPPFLRQGLATQEQRLEHRPVKLPRPML
jgi:hypothetical protein